MSADIEGNSGGNQEHYFSVKQWTNLTVFLFSISKVVLRKGRSLWTTFTKYLDQSIFPLLIYSKILDNNKGFSIHFSLFCPLQVYFSSLSFCIHTIFCKLTCFYLKWASAHHDLGAIIPKHNFFYQIPKRKDLSD